MQKNVAGAIGGMAAGVPMVVALTALDPVIAAPRLRRMSPRRLARSVGLAKTPSAVERHLATASGHFGFGGAAGALYPPVSRVLPGPALLKGALFGAGVWAVGQLANGRLARNARREFNGMHLASHVLWGAATAWIAKRLIERGHEPEVACARESRSFGDGPVAPTPSDLQG